jgi:hypothetical protein
MFRPNLVCFCNELKQDYDLAKVGVEGSNPFARSKIFKHRQDRAFSHFLTAVKSLRAGSPYNTCTNFCVKVVWPHQFYRPFVALQPSHNVRAE